MTAVDTSIVVPTVGRPSLAVLCEALAKQSRPVDVPVILVDDRPEGAETELVVDGDGLDLRILRSGGGGPACARNLGWRAARSRWVSFLDDDVVPDRNWFELLATDLDRAAEAVGSTGRVRVPLPQHRRPTDWERGTAGLATACWITADLTYRRDALSAVGGFDERFRRAFREDADLALRLGADRGTVQAGIRSVTHPVRPADGLASLRQQAGNADDRLMRALHGRAWRARAHAPRGRIRRHAATTAAGLIGVSGLVAGRRRMALLGAVGWLAGTTELAWARIAPGPRDHVEVRRMLVTSAAIPIAACWHAVRGELCHRRAEPWHGLPDLVLLDRDGTVIHDVPYNGDPALVAAVPGARAALDRLRERGLRLAVVTNQSAVGAGRITRAQVDAVHARVEELVGPIEAWYVCPHLSDQGCSCRKPAPGLVKQACAELGVAPARCVVVGDIGTDIEAARAAGASAVLVPTPQTRSAEIAAAPRVAPTLTDAVDRILAGDW